MDYQASASLLAGAGLPFPRPACRRIAFYDAARWPLLLAGHDADRVDEPQGWWAGWRLAPRDPSLSPCSSRWDELLSSARRRLPRLAQRCCAGPSGASARAPALDSGLIFHMLRKQPFREAAPWGTDLAWAQRGQQLAGLRNTHQVDQIRRASI